MTLKSDVGVKKKVSDKLREAAKEPSRRYKGTNPLNGLSDKQLFELYIRYEQGQQDDRILRLVRLEWGCGKEIPYPTMRGFMQRFKKAVLTPIEDILAEAGSEEEAGEIRKKLKIIEELDGLGSLRWLIQEQKDRVEAYRGIEKKSLIPSTAANAVIRDLGDLLDKYIKIQMDLGLIETKEDKKDKEMRDRFMYILSDKVQNSGDNLIQAANKLLEAAENEAITIEVETEEELVPQGKK